MDLFIIFFFQAEDGIRDYKVTGVQTCALPIYEEKLAQLQELREQAIHANPQAEEKQHERGKLTARERIDRLLDPRSEERRVGKEGRALGAARHEKKKKKSRTRRARVRERYGDT